MTRRRIVFACLFGLGLAGPMGAMPALAAGRAMTIDDTSRFLAVDEARLSPDGRWVAYTVKSTDVAKDKALTDLWMSSRDGSQQVRLTTSGDVKGALAWRPDGQMLTFLAARGTDDDKKKGPQLWQLDRRGGEAQKMTDVPGSVASYAWSPDGRQIVLAVDDADPRESPDKIAGWERKTEPPLVIDGFRFKHDMDGYLRGLHTHLFLFDPVSRAATRLTKGKTSESAPAWSPDARRIAFMSNRAADPDRTEETSVIVMDAAAGAAERILATGTAEEDATPAWSPDGRWIAFSRGDADRFSAYQLYRLAIVPTEGGATTIVTRNLDRAVRAPFIWSADSSRVTLTVDDDRASHVAQVAISDGAVTALTGGRRTVDGLSGGPDGDLSFIGSSASQAGEVHVLAHGSTQRITRHNDAWLADMRLGHVSDFTSRSSDGGEVHGLMTTPPDYVSGRRYPTLLLIHGGPNGQDAHRFAAHGGMLREVLAARGYVVLQVNYRGSAGRGDAYQKAIYADWGNKEIIDLLGAVDWAVAEGIADPQRLGIGGWSYGGILTDYMIATDRRFKAAVSGAGSANQISMFGSDQYVVQYEKELGPPWKTQDLWLKLSYPFFHADRIQTPTLFLSGLQDFNVPTAGSEQMYQALKMLGVDTRMVLYPAQFHGLTLPSYQRDVLQRFADWFDRYLQPGSAR